MGVIKEVGLMVALLVVIGLLTTELNAKTLGSKIASENIEVEQYQALLDAIAKGDEDLHKVDLTKLLHSQPSQPRTNYADDDTKVCDVPENVAKCVGKSAKCEVSVDDPTQFQCKCDRFGELVDTENEKCAATICEVKANKDKCEGKSAKCVGVVSEPTKFQCKCDLGGELVDSENEQCPATVCDVQVNKENCEAKEGICVVIQADATQFECSCIDGPAIPPSSAKKCSVDNSTANATCTTECGSFGKCNDGQCECFNNFAQNETGVCVDKCTLAKSENETISENCQQCEPTGDENGYKCVCEGLFKPNSNDSTVCLLKNPCTEKLEEEVEIGDVVCAKENKECQLQETNSTQYKCICKGNQVEDIDGTCVDPCVKAMKTICAERLATKCQMNGGTPVCICPNGFYMETDNDGQPDKCKGGMEIYVYQLPGINGNAGGNEPTTTEPTESASTTNPTAAAPDAELEEVHMYSSGLANTYATEPVRTELAQKIFNALREASDKLVDIKIIGDALADPVVVEAVFSDVVDPNVFNTLDCKPIPEKNQCAIGDLVLFTAQLDAFKDKIKSSPKIDDLCSLDGKQRACNEDNGQKCNKLEAPSTAPYECLCKGQNDGYETVQGAFYRAPFTSQVCRDYDECAGQENICDNGRCLNLQPNAGKFACKCNDNYKNPSKENSQECVNSCTDHLCASGQGVCKHSGNSYYCSCNEKFTGDKCEKAIVIPEPGESKEKLNTAESNVIIVGAVLGAILLVTIIVSAVSIKKLRSKLNKQNRNNQPLDDFNSGRRGYDNAAGPR